MRSDYPHISLQNLEILCSVAELQSVSRTAERMGIAQPAVTAHLRGIENRLGVKLFARVGRNIRLTESGARVVRWAGELLTRTREVEREIGGLTEGTEGRVVIAASMTVGTYVLPEIVAGFRATHPAASIATLVTNPRAAIETVRSGASDFAIVVMDLRQDHANLTVQPLWAERLLLVSAPQSRLIGPVVSPDQLATIPFVSAPKGIVWRDIEDGVLQSIGVGRRNIPVEFSHPEAFKRLVRADVCLAFLFECSAKDDVARGDLRIVNIRGADLRIPIYLVHRTDKTFSPLQERLIAHIKNSKLPTCATEQPNRSRPAVSYVKVGEGRRVAKR